jgi:hypothetical protein
MVDMPISDLPSKWLPNAPTGFAALRRMRWLLAAILISAGCWVAVNEATAKDKCQTTFGRLAVRFKLDSYYSNCQCMTHSLDFSDSCNSMYIPLI